MRLQDKIVLVTASTRGIGLAIAKQCAAEGARVYMAARNIERPGPLPGRRQSTGLSHFDGFEPGDTNKKTPLRGAFLLAYATQLDTMQRYCTERCIR